MLNVYKASAGSGKTYTLALDYIRLLLGIKKPGTETYELNLAHDEPLRLKHHNRHRYILAITFTRKATEEMKSRILKELETLADPKQKSNYQETLQKSMRCSREHLAVAASLALRELLFDYQNFNVSTIDAFFQRVLHTFARELDRQPDYNVELNDNAAMQTAVGEMLDNFNAFGRDNPELESWLFKYMSAMIRDGQKSNFFNRQSRLHRKLVSLVSHISDESFKPYAKAMRKYLASGSLAKYSDSVERLRVGLMADIQERARRVFAAGPGSADPSWLQSTKPATFVVEYFLAGKPLPMSDWNGSKYMKSMTTPGDPVNPFRKGVPDTSRTVQTKKLFEDAYRLTILYYSLAPLRSALTQLGLLSHAWDYLLKFSEENNTLLISDTNELISRIIGKDETPFIYERMGVRLNHFLIDEFQDTSKMQWQNLSPLVANGLSEDHDSLVIGDEKQSIYRFRNSDSSILHTRVGQEMARYIDPEKTAHDSQSTNYRSASTIVKFNNTLFSLLAQAAGVEGFENVVQKVSDKHAAAPGYVRFCKVEKPKIGTGSIDREASMLRPMAREIMRQHDSGYSWSDIAVIVNTNKEAREVVDYLIRNHFGEISVQSDEAMLLTASADVQLIISVLSHIDQDLAERAEKPMSKYLTRAQVLRAINRCVFAVSKALATEAPTAGDHDEAMLKDIASRALSNALSADHADSDRHGGISDIIDEKPASLTALVETIIRHQILPGEGGKRTKQFAYLAAFQDAVTDFVSNEGGSLHAFLDWWKIHGQTLTVPGSTEVDALRVMTIHKSKGLEFHCVHLPFCSWPNHWTPTLPPQVWTPLPHIDGLDPALAPPVAFMRLESALSNPLSPFCHIYADEYNKAMADNMNKTYVAFTRARTELMGWYTPETDNIATMLDEAFAAGMPDDIGPNAEWLVDLRPGQSDTGFELGVPTAKSLGEESSEEIAIAADYIVTDHKAVKPLLKVNDVLDLERDLDDDSALAVPMPEIQEDLDDEMRRQGVILHDMMSQIYVKADLDKAVAAVAGKLRLSAAEADAYRKIINDFLNIGDERIERWYERYSKAYVEQPIYAPEGDRVRRPDRIVIDADGKAEILDYKFTDNPEHLNMASQKTQLREYIALLREMGFDSVEGYLCYPRLKKILHFS